MMTYQDKVNAGEPKVLTVEKWNELIDSPKVKNICRAIAGLDSNADDYNDRKQALKKRLPIIIPHAASFTGGRRVSAEAIPSGLAMLDVDHVENPKDFLSQRSKVKSQRSESGIQSRETAKKDSDEEAARRDSAEDLTGGGSAALTDRPDNQSGVTAKKRLIENGIVLVAITASGKGLRVIGARAQGETIEAAQMRMAQALGIEEYDAVTKDLARASYVVPRDYILWMDEAELFAEREWKDDPSLREAASENTGEAETETYRGLPYADIVEELMLQTGNAGGVVQGERNTVYFSLANYMRYICDFNAETLLRVLPDFGLTEQERRQVIASAIGRPRKSQMPMLVQGAIATVEREHELERGDGVKLPKASEMEMPKLPKLLQILCRRLPSSYRPAMIIASLPVLGTLATRIRFNYLDMQEQSLSFFSCITAPAASGKSFIRKPLDLLLTPINEQDVIEREKEQKYKEALRAAKNSKFQPEDPHPCPRNNGVSVSIAKLLQLLTYADGKHLIAIGEEMDTLVKSERAGVWSQKSDIYRLAFDNAEYGQAYMSETSFNAHIRVYYNLLLTGTPNSMRRFFKDLENGLATRVCFAQLPDTSFCEIPVFAPYSEAEKAEIIRWARRLDTESGTIECQAVSKAIAAWLEEKRQQAIDADNLAMDTLRRRAAVIGFRAGMLCYLLEDRQPTKLVGPFAQWVAEYVFRNQMELWGEQMEQELKGAIEEQAERGAASSLLALLPMQFTTADLIKLRVKNNQSVTPTSIRMLLSRWKRVGRIVKVGDGEWKRLQ